VKALRELLHPREVHIHMRTGLLGIKNKANCRQKLAERLDLLFLRIVHIPKQLLDTLSAT